MNILSYIPPTGHKIYFQPTIKAWNVKSTLEEHFFNFQNSYLLSSGTAALYKIFQALAITKAKSEIIIPAYSCPSIAAAILKAGYKPILCDIDVNNFGFDYNKLTSLISPKTRAIVNVYLLGIPNNVFKIKKICSQHDIILIEDCAQLWDNTLAGRRLGGIGDFSVFSFGRGKPLSLLEGGLLVLNNLSYKKLIENNYHKIKEKSSLNYLFKLISYSLFFKPALYWIPQKFPGLKLGETIFSTEFTLKRASKLLEKILAANLYGYYKIKSLRSKIMGLYFSRLTFNDTPFTLFPYSEDNTYIRFPLLFADVETRNRVLIKLQNNGIGATGLYPVTLNKLAGLSDILQDKNEYVNGNLVAKCLLTLPINNFVTEKKVVKIVDIIKKSL